MTDEEYVKRYRYSPRMRMVLPLKAGGFAVFNSIRQLQAIVPASELMGALLSVPVDPRYDWPEEPPITKRITVDDLLAMLEEPGEVTGNDKEEK